MINILVDNTNVVNTLSTHLKNAKPLYNGNVVIHGELDFVPVCISDNHKILNNNGLNISFIFNCKPNLKTNVINLFCGDNEKNSIYIENKIIEWLKIEKLIDSDASKMIINKINTNEVHYDCEFYWGSIDDDYILATIAFCRHLTQDIADGEKYERLSD